MARRGPRLRPGRRLVPRGSGGGREEVRGSKSKEAEREQPRGGGKEALPRRRLVAEFRECSTLGLEPFSAEPPSSSCYSHSDPPPGEGEEKREEGEEKRKEGEEKREEGENGGDDDETSRRKRKSSDGGEENGQNKRGNKTRRQRRRRRRFDSVSCMFAAHYFCSSDAALSMFLSNVARNLRPVSFWIFCYFSFFFFRVSILTKNFKKKWIRAASSSGPSLPGKKSWPPSKEGAGPS